MYIMITALAIVSMTVSGCLQVAEADDGYISVPYKTACVDRLHATPDMTQTDPMAELPNGGKMYCGPVSASNSLMWLGENGYPNLIPLEEGPDNYQFNMARLLGNNDFMQTDPQGGTAPGSVLRGLERYIVNRGYDCTYIKYQGWRRHPSKYSTNITTPSLEWIKNGFSIPGTAVLLNVGWYSYNPKNETYTRKGGHWVTMVGFGVDKNHSPADNVVIIHDPATRATGEQSREYIKLEPVFKGKINGSLIGLPRSAAGFYKMAGDMNISSNADFALLDGAIVVQIQTSGQESFVLNK